MKKYLTYPLVALLLFTAQACSDDDSATTPEPEPPTVAEMLLGKWFFVSVTTAGETTTLEGSCEKKSYFRFNTDGTAEKVVFHVDENEDCIADYYYSDYALTSDETQLVFSVESSSSMRDILSITPIELVLQYDETKLAFQKESAMDSE